MHTREGAQRSAPIPAPHASTPSVPPLVGGMRQAALTALYALVGCALLIAVGAAMSICWAIHPLLNSGRRRSLAGQSPCRSRLPRR